MRLQSILSTHEKSSSFISEPKERLNEGGHGEYLVDAGGMARGFFSYRKEENSDGRHMHIKLIPLARIFFNFTIFFNHENLSQFFSIVKIFSLDFFIPIKSHVYTYI